MQEKDQLAEAGSWIHIRLATVLCGSACEENDHLTVCSIWETISNDHSEDHEGLQAVQAKTAA